MGQQFSGFSAAECLYGDVTEFCSRLIRFDTSNFGSNDARPERPAAEWVATQLSDAGYSAEVFESAPGRANTVARLPGTDRSAPALVLHGHLDVVPAHAPDWTVDPFAGEIRDGAIWGRGALDIKQFDAMLLALAVHYARIGYQPPRDVVLAFVADEEDGGAYGADFLVERHPELFEGARTAVGESGGYSVHLPDGGLLYPIGCAERGSAWMQLTAHGRSGHGSRRNTENAVTRLARAVARIADYEWPVRLVPAVDALLSGLQKHLGVEVDPADLDSLGQLGYAARLVENTVRNSANPTMLSAGYKANVIPGEATAVIDGRVLAGTEDEFTETIDRLVGAEVEWKYIGAGRALGTTHESTEFVALAAAVRAEAPDALVLPFCMTGGTDAKSFSRLGMECYGFAPGTYPASFRQWEYVHGVDEHVPIDGLHSGVRMLDSFVRTAP